MERLGADDAGAGSADLVARNVARLRALFPEAVSEDGVDFEVLRQLLGGASDEREERYGLTWHGKRSARQLALTPPAGTLRPVPDESVAWAATQNLMIEGDNLEVLKLLQKSYATRVKLIYIDPPYNTGRDFVYPDDFRDSVRNYQRLTGQVDAEGRRLTSNAETSGRYHTAWLNLMYPRLQLARELLREDGFICVSIGEEELANLRRLMDEIYGEENFRNLVLLRRYDKNLNRQFLERGLKTLNVGAEFVLVYAKSDEALLNPVYRAAPEARRTRGYWKGFWNAADRPTMRYPLLGVTPESGQWKWKEEVALEAVRNHEAYAQQHADRSLEEHWEQTDRRLRFIRRNPNGTGRNLGVEHWIPPASGILRSSNWTDLLASGSLRGLGLDFDSPKSEEAIAALIEMCSDAGDLVLDFFAGSGTTGHAVWNLAARGEGDRRFVLVQLPEPVADAEHGSIAGLTAERLRRAAAQLGAAHPDLEADLGFRVLRLDRSNLRAWAPDPDADLEPALLEHVDAVAPGRSEDDLLHELLLELGLDLCAPVESRQIAGTTVYSVAGGALLACLAERIGRDGAAPLAEGIAAWHGAQAPAGGAVCVFRDSAFDDDVARLTLATILQQHSSVRLRTL